MAVKVNVDLFSMSISYVELDNRVYFCYAQHDFGNNGNCYLCVYCKARQAVPLIYVAKLSLQKKQ
jgi:hypothetical protein